MSLSKFSVNYPITTLMIFLAILLFGVVTFFGLKIDLLPDIQPPAISVITFYPGADAEDVESDVTKYLEDELTLVEGLDYITSISQDNISVVTCHFEWGTDLDVASNDVRDRVDLAMDDLPDEIERPVIFKFSSSDMPVLILGLIGDQNYRDLYFLAKEKIADELKRTPGVGAVLVEGGLVRQIKVVLDPIKLATYHLTPQQIEQVIRSENIDLPTGKVIIGPNKYYLKIRGRFKDPYKLNNIIVANINNKPVYLRDIGSVSDAYEEEKMAARVNGKKGVIILIQKQRGANTVEIVDKIKEKMGTLRKLLPPNTKLVTLMDFSRDIRLTISNLRDSALWGILFVVLVTYFFLGRFKASSVVSLTIPFSLIGAFAFMYVAGYTINVVTLMSLAIAIGMVVDNSIVVLDSVFHKLERGMNSFKAAIEGTKEVGLAIVASTLTTVVVFFPMLFTKGLVGVMFRQLASIVIVTLSLSLFVSLSLAPMLLSQFYKRGLPSHKSLLARLGEGIFHYLEDKYYYLLSWVLNNRKKVLIGVLIFLVAGIVTFHFVGSELTPAEDSGDLSLEIYLPQNTDIHTSVKVADKIDKIVEKKIPAKYRKSYYYFTGETPTGYNVALGFEEGAYYIDSGVKLVPVEDRPFSAKEAAYWIKKEIEKIPGLQKISVTAISSIQRVFLGSGKPIVIEILGPDLEEDTQVAKQIKKTLESIPGTLNVTISRKAPRTELNIKLDREKLNRFGLTTGYVADTIRRYFYGKKSGKYRERDKDFDIFIQMPEEKKNSLEYIRSLPILLPNGKIAYLKDFADLKFTPGEVSITRKDRTRYIKVSADTYKRSMGSIMKDFSRKLKELKIPDDVEIKYGGDIREKNKAFKSLSLLLFIGIILVYMVMASQFESLVFPFIIMFAVPFAFVGTVFVWFITHTTLSIFSFLGSVMLTGIVVNNGIVLVDYINQLRGEGKELKEAIIEGGKRRLRPVLMTTLTTLFGVLPMALSRSEGKEIWNSLGWTLFGGLFFSTMVTLVLIPTIYYYFGRKFRSKYEVLKERERLEMDDQNL